MSLQATLNAISDAAKSNASILSLRNMGLSRIPEQLSRLTHLRVLDLSDNHLTELPGQLIGLRSLQMLNLRGNQLSRFPKRVAALADLHSLDLGNNQLANLADDIGELKTLQFLDLKGNRLTALPPAFVRLSNLRLLELGQNRLSQLPEAIQSLSHLQQLGLAGNRIEALPVWLCHLSQVGRLDVQGNQLTQFPPAILKLHHLKRLHLHGNPLTNVPPELIPHDPWQSTDVAKLRAYFRQLHEAGIDYLCEAKLVLVGEGDVGKTSLANKLLDPSYELKAGERSTQGIDILEWRFPAHIVVGDPGGQTRDVDVDLKVHIWDFAGQEITHATHQFFLTKRSLCALLVDTRRESPNFDYWLSIVELLSDESPVLVVKNEKQDIPCLINESAARARFPNLKEVRAVNLADNRGLSALTADIRAHIQSLPHIGTRLPATWKRVRESLASRSENYIPAQTFFELCDSHGFTRHDDKLQLSEYLHDIGVCLHFQRDPALANIIILKPDWVTQAVYRVLRDREVVESRGRLRRAVLDRIWHEPDYASVRSELLEIMRKFRLCYPLGESGEYIVPQLLARNQPEYPWDARQNLHVYYDYDFMPRGILPRFVVILHRAIERQDWVWHEGVVLAREGARAEIVEDYDRRKIRVRISGRTPQHLQLLGAIASAFDDIHSAYHRLSVRKMIPCVCDGCGENPKFFFDTNRVRDFASRGRLEMQCQETGEMVKVLTLLKTAGEKVDDSDEVRLAWDSLARGESFMDVLASTGSPAHSELNLRTGAGWMPLPGSNEFPLAIADDRQVFVSYAWGDESGALVEQVEKTFLERGLSIVRDIKQIGYKMNVATFMDRLSRGCRVIVIISDSYLRSENCMRELVGIAEHTGTARAFVERIFPIVTPDAKIHRPAERIAYVKHWEEEKAKLNMAMKGLDQNNLEGFREDIDLYERIRNTIANLMVLLGNLNTFTVNQHINSDFQVLFEAVTRASTEHKQRTTQR